MTGTAEGTTRTNPTATAAALLPQPVDRWDTAGALGLTGRDEVVHRSHLVGADRALTREGGGNFSAKGVAPDLHGELVDVLWMSAWGCDGATTTAEDFPVLRLAELRRLRAGAEVDESAMVAHLVSSGLVGEQRRPGIETLTHAFIPAAHVDHCHPDAVIALTSFPGGREAAEEEFGDEAIWFDYRQFDVGVARELADRIEAAPRCRFVLLAHHGLFTWADTSEACYRNSLEAVARATAALGRALRGPADLGGRVVEPLDEAGADAVLGEVLPVLRGELGRGTPGVVLHVDRSPEAVEFTSSARGPELSQVGPGCPDHVVTVGFRPLPLDAPTPGDPELRRRVVEAVAGFRRWYDGSYERHATPVARAMGKRGSAPKVLLLPGVGVVAGGADAAKARLCADHFEQTMVVARATDAAGGYRTLTEEQSVVDEYWPLMRLKPQLKPPDGRLSGRVALVGGGSPEAVAAIAGRLASADAHVALAGVPGEVAEALVARHGERRAVAVGSGERAVREAVLAYGGFDVVVDLDAGGALADAALPVLAAQGLGGSLLTASGEERADELADTAARLAALGEPHGVGAAAVTSADPAAIADAVLFLTTTDTWRNPVLRPLAGRKG
ncbi:MULTISPECIES: class II aldolase/adducin family protein [Actinosynnema]|uniref:class II aldolase/adducin family protein n=1 Tax=Actinosynnema TaxID=40566 RepID=UPI0020A57BF3|nr:class II aldolase/adducin family protein [Actinosynnema pretiosum]MCP2098731.1 Rhamnose utilization protein RhaD, predicted bifunctional aldolase and dehydrogenase [Actinosynnema pretiosum]